MEFDSQPLANEGVCNVGTVHCQCPAASPVVAFISPFGAGWAGTWLSGQSRSAACQQLPKPFLSPHSQCVLTVTTGRECLRGVEADQPEMLATYIDRITVNDADIPHHRGTRNA